MTTLDKAFIKAYSDNASQPSPPHALQATAIRTETPRGRLGATFDKGSHVAASDEEPEFAILLPETLNASPYDPRIATLPLSSFAHPAPIADACRPLLEIDRAAWPKACGELLVHARADWDRFVEQLVERANQGRKCVALASLARGEGRTTVALALAKHLAGRGLRPVIVDADVQNPALARSCGVSAQTGWDDLVASELPLGEALIAAVEDGVTLMPLRTVGSTAAALSQSLRIGSIFGTLREHYDMVLLDAMPLVDPGAIADFVAFAKAIHLDALYLLQDLRSTTRDQLTAAAMRLRQCGLPVVGVIENFVSPAATDKSPLRSETTALAGRHRHMGGR